MKQTLKGAKIMKKLLSSMLVFAVLAIMPTFAQAGTILISTTTSTENSGLLDYLLPKFTRDTGIQVRVVAKGTGAAIKDGMDGNVDAILVHDTQRENQFVKDGYGTQRYYVMFNDFVVIGPDSDPAKAKETKSTAAAFEAIANAKAPFISRGDDSGTHSKEGKIWAETKVNLDGKFPADASWYRSIGQGMGKTIIMADEVQGYTLTDRATYYAMKYAQPKATTDLEIISENHSDLLNPYGYIPVSQKKHKHVNIKDASALGGWLVSPNGKKAIEGFKAQGKQLFFVPKK